MGCFSILHFHTRMGWEHPMDPVESGDAVRALRKWKGRDTISMMHADGDEAIAKAMFELSVLMRESELGDSQSSGAIEAVNSWIQEGTRAQFAQAGMPISWWTSAVQHYCTS